MEEISRKVKQKIQKQKTGEKVKNKKKNQGLDLESLISN